MLLLVRSHLRPALPRSKYLTVPKRPGRNRASGWVGSWCYRVSSSSDWWRYLLVESFRLSFTNARLASNRAVENVDEHGPLSLESDTFRIAFKNTLKFTVASVTLSCCSAWSWR